MNTHTYANKQIKTHAHIYYETSTNRSTAALLMRNFSVNNATAVAAASTSPIAACAAAAATAAVLRWAVAS
jgi:hypothetical protein